MACGNLGWWLCKSRLLPLSVVCIWFSRLHRLLMRSARLPSVSKANVSGQLVSCYPRCSLTHSRPYRTAKAARLYKSACLKEKTHSVGILRFRHSNWSNTPQPDQDMRGPVGYPQASVTLES